jgi:hypothetical protein
VRVRAYSRVWGVLQDGSTIVGRYIPTSWTPSGKPWCADCNRPTLDTLRAAGFAIDQVVRTELAAAPPFARPLAVGSAVVVPVAA